MLFWSKGCPLRKTEKGEIQWVMGLFFLLFLLLLTCTQLQLETYGAAALYLEDTLAASNLASAVIDLEEYGCTHNIRIVNPVNAYDIFCDAVKANLQLGEDWTGHNTDLVSGRVEVVHYIIYNVNDDVVQVFWRQQDGTFLEWESGKGSVFAPNGIQIDETSIYSEIAFPIEGIFGISINARKGKLVDIVAE